jgi:hypothetical protein
MNDFSQGGWDGWIELTQIDANNPYGAYVEAQSSLFSQISQQNTKYTQQLEQGRGFLSYERCQAGYEITQSLINEHASEGDASPYAGYKAGDCLDNKTETVTPGSVIESQLNQVVGSGERRLEAADELDEIIGALLNQLLGKVVGGVGGLLGTSRSSSGSPSFSSQLYNENEKGSSNTGNRVACTTAPDTTDENGNIIPGATNCVMNDPTPPPPQQPGGADCSTDENGNTTCTSTGGGTGTGNGENPGGGGTGGTSEGGIPADFVCNSSNEAPPLTPTDDATLALYVNASYKGWYGVDDSASDIAYWVDHSNHYGQFSNGTCYAGWNAYWEQRMKPGNDGSADPNLGGQMPQFLPATASLGGEPASLLSDLQVERSKYGPTMTANEIGSMLNTIAWNHKNEGWGLSFKNSGNYCTSPASSVACDILYYQPTNTLYDVLYAADPNSGSVTPQWNNTGTNTNSSRPWVAPVQA